MPPLDYTQPAHWLWRPDTYDACEGSATVTRVFADGRLEKQRAITTNDPPVDCLYVCPTIFRDPGGNSDATADAEEREVARQQLAHFAGACRLFAPVYRQVTLTALRKLRAGEDIATNREMAYADVKAAWGHYLDNDSQGRGVVLIGHDQGAGLLTRLIAAEIDGRPEKGRLISAIIPGAGVEAPLDGVTGGSFASVPLCTGPESTSCVILWSAFRAEAPPPANSLLGRAATNGRKVACVNPADLDGSGLLMPVLPTTPVLFEEVANPAPSTTLPGATPINTPFVALPGLLAARCINREGASYLAISVNADPADLRTDTMNGDVIVDGAVRPQWGLHLFDLHRVMGNLQVIVSRQSAKWLEQRAAAGQLPTDLQ